METGSAVPPPKPPPRTNTTSPRAAASSSTPTAIADTVRRSLGFPGALECLLLLSLATLVCSIACCSTRDSGWFKSRPDGLRLATDVGWGRFKQDVNDIW